MRVTTAALLLAASACVPDAPRTHTDGGTTTADPKCASTETVTGDILVDSGTMADAIPTGCWTLAGKLTIRGSAVTSLSMLGNVRGATEVELDNTLLATFDTQATLEVSGPIKITRNAKLTGVGKLRAGTTATSVLVDSNPLLTSLGGAFDDLTQVASTVTIKNNPKLTTIELPALELVGDSQIGQSLTITNNAGLTDIELPAFTLPNRLEISSNAALTTIGDIPAKQIVSDLVIKDNAKLTALPAFSALAKIGGIFTVSNNATLTSFGEFPLLTYAGGITLDSNPVLASIAGLPASTAVQIYGLTITNNAALTDLGRLSHEVYNSISITSNAQLPNCNAREVDVCTNHAVQSTITGNKSQTNCTSWCGR